MNQRIVVLAISVLMSLSMSGQGDILISAAYVYTTSNRLSFQKRVFDAGSPSQPNYYFAHQPTNGIQAGVEYRAKLVTIIPSLADSRFFQHFGLGAKLHFQYFGFEARHEVGFESQGIIDGVEHRLYQYDLDKARIFYISPGITATYTVENFIAITYGIERMLVASHSMERVDLFINNPVGYFERGEPYPVSSEDVFRSPGFTQYIQFEFKVSDRITSSLGHQWSGKSILNERLLADNPFAHPYRNFYIGLSWRIRL